MLFYEKKVVSEQVVEEEVEKEATRAIRMTIKHLSHSLVHTPSNVAVLSADKQKEFYEKQLNVETLQFYYLQSGLFEETDFNNELEQSEALARIVMQLKAISGQYPDPNQLKEIIQQNYSHLFGYKHSENVAISSNNVLMHTAQASGILPIE